MATGVLMPKAGITVEECVITEWLKKEGDQVNVGDVLFTYETDKASFECESTAAGTLLKIFYEDGDEVPVLVNVCAIGQPGDSIEGLKEGWAHAIEVNEDGQSNISDIYAGGDIARGAATVVLAMGDGRRAANKMAEELLAK